MSNQFTLRGTPMAHLISEGRVELYASKIGDGADGRLYHFATLEQDRSFIDIAPLTTETCQWACVAKSSSDAVIEESLRTPDGCVKQEDFVGFVQRLEVKLQEQNELFWKRRAHLEDCVDRAVDRLTDVNSRLSSLGTRDFEDSDDLVAACMVLGNYLGVEIQVPTSDVVDHTLTPMESILHLSDIRYRDVTLGGKWWRRSTGPLMGYLSDGTPVVMLPKGLNSYSLYNPKLKTTTKLTAELAQKIDPHVLSVYRTFPKEKLGIKNLAKFLLGTHIYTEIALIMVFTFVASLIQVLPPIISKQIFDEIVPGNMRGMLAEVIFILVAFQVAQMGFTMVINVGFSRIKGKIDLALHAATWDRLLSQKIQFFYKYTVGEMLEKVKGIAQINSGLSLDLLKTLTATLFSFINIIVMYNYSPSITRKVLWIFAAYFLVSGLLMWNRYRLSLKAIQVSNRASSLSHQLVQGIQRIKTSFAEEHAYALWSNYEAERRYLTGRINSLETAQTAFNTFFNLASVAAVYLLISEDRALGAGVFVAYIGTFLIFQGAMGKFLGVVTTICGLIPTIKNVAPLLQAVPGQDMKKTTPKDIDGSLELNHVSFNYDEYGHTVLHDVSFRVEKGESVGIVGLSGCGKSTLMKLILGLYEPTGGKIYFGGYDLSTVDKQYLRRQLGVVLQNSSLSIGSIYSNIAQNDHTITEKDVITALQKMDLMKLVETLPEGIYTSLEAEGSKFSDGQKQQLLIAQAIVKGHPYVFLDEATSHLDNVMTKQVMTHVNKMPGTKIIVAQRLATVEHCDRIIVMADGKVMADGSYDEIINKRHMFGVVFDHIKSA